MKIIYEDRYNKEPRFCADGEIAGTLRAMKEAGGGQTSD